METKKFRQILPKKVLREVKRVKSENDNDMEQGRKEGSKKGKKWGVCEKISTVKSLSYLARQAYGKPCTITFKAPIANITTFTKYMSRGTSRKREFLSTNSAQVVQAYNEQLVRYKKIKLDNSDAYENNKHYNQIMSNIWWQSYFDSSFDQTKNIPKYKNSSTTIEQIDECDKMPSHKLVALHDKCECESAEEKGKKCILIVLFKTNKLGYITENYILLFCKEITFGDSVIKN